MSKLVITLKQGKELEEIEVNNVKFFSFEKQYLAITMMDTSHSYYRLSTVLAVVEIKE